MSEKINHPILDPEVAYHMAHAEVPHRAAADEAAGKVRQQFDGVSPSPTREETAEQVMSQAEIDQLIDGSSYGVTLRLGDGYRDIRRIFGGKVSPYQKNWGPRLGGDKPSLHDNKSFNQAGVTEAVTLMPATEFFNGTADPDDDWRIVHYHTLVTNNGETYKYAPQGDSRGGQHMNFDMLLPLEKADRLVSSMKQNPQLVRDMVEKMVLHHDTYRGSSKGGVSKGEWQGARPPYEEWAEVNGGVNRIAFNTAFSQGPDKSEIIEF